ncbi:hypothetical protein P3719_18670 [Vibrio parahaemolyticus]|uniref:DUF1311 domain-containing protein n=1 Tax=Vibrio diabolicus TaxID=50719 RepID=A0AA92LVR3_9VIBR|nr:MULTISPECIES: hypothetical protein [Vibrio]MDW1807495.1 hypothetical protein [Vibrio sp. Vb2362]MDW2296347.1 hypothetical protein [Vibrio sp. 1404]OOH98803.1 hypothetical protein BIW16_18500 [Vibrio sp. OULL4]APX09861.1 hypothetical protein BWP24_26985 [Vibrio campbellii]MBO0148591.1 hypothetical protein [Vibrio sp. Vb2424]
MFKKTLLSLSLAVLLPGTANAVICTDPTGLGQIISQSAQDAMLWAEEKGLKISEMTMTELMEEWKASQDTMRELASTQAISNSVSETSNLELQAKMEPSPLMCDGIAAVSALYEATDDFYCEAQTNSLDFAVQLSDEIDCEGDRCETGLQSLADESVSLLEGVTHGDTVELDLLNIKGVLPGMGEGGYSKSTDEKERTDTMLKVLFSSGEINKMPRGENNQVINENSGADAKMAYNRWLKRHLRTTAGFNTALRVNGLTNPRDENGRPIQSILEQIKADIDFYNSPEQIKLYGNGGDKSCYSRKAAMVNTQREMDDWLNTPAGQACKANFTTVEQVQRMNAQIDARVLALLGHILDSQLSSEFNLGLQTQLLNEIAGNARKY